ncbi:arp2/3 complex-activating protein rickA-like isoform X1 [Pieris rapae]|uniref:arp2/3 complex-activating protein rickA-like isoform X1 n=1 Tax=Pieris rapae TaxID=64459 RepID=UPI001E27DEA0|nr:arp2/3 complex-activating protein rickA-like isoform X1 [Pieris rapae]XP_045490034.1 arp2/3 complex-activating protein rickA-like isoform X1 [Pieris rapae]
MNNNNKYDGSQSAGSSHTTPATNGSRNVTNNKKPDTCRDYMWGKCTKGSSCRFRHELDIEKLKKTVKFCHDYQNRAPCTREVCTFIHATKDEETLFLTTGKLPKVLAERHANMSMSSAETIPQIANYIQESLAGPPPPPPPPQPAPQSSSVNGPQLTYNMGHMAPPMQPGMGMGSMHMGPINMGPIPPQMMSMPVAPPPPAIQMHHLPPPPPPPPTQSSTSSSLSTPPVYTAPPPPTMRVSLNQELPQPPTPKLNMDRFDPSKPPPPFIPNTSLKRPTVSDNMKAGPSKIRKEEEAIVDDAACDSCRERQIRIDVYQKESDKLFARVEYQKLMHKKKYEEFQRKEEILKILLNPEIYKIIEDLLLNEDGSQVQESDNQNAIGDLTPPRTVESLSTLMTRPNVNNSIQNSLLFAEHLRDGNKKRDDQPEYNRNNTYYEGSQASYSQSVSVPTTSKTQSSNLSKNVSTTASPSYFYYNMPPPITRSFMTPSTSMAPAAGTSLMAYQHNGMQGPSQAMTKPSTSAPPPPSKPNNQTNQKSDPYSPPTSYYNSYQ